SCPRQARKGVFPLFQRRSAPQYHRTFVYRFHCRKYWRCVCLCCIRFSCYTGRNNVVPRSVTDETGKEKITITGYEFPEGGTFVSDVPPFPAYPHKNR